MSKRNRISDESVEENSTIEEIRDDYRRQKKVLKYNFSLVPIKPLTENQNNAFHANGSGKHLLLFGVAGTGKTFLGSYFALNDLLGGLIRRVIIIRSAVTTRDQGFLPGTLQEKMMMYESPYRDIFASLCGGRRDVYDLLKKKGYLEFMSTSFIRGVTFDDAIIIVDEVQNCTDHEISSILTRVGNNTRVILCGDYRQDDLKMTGKKSQESGMKSLIKIANVMPSFSCVEFGIQDIVRSGFCKEYIITRINLGLD
ncbi:PhoH Phosphate starvation-inducible protein PhoH, predicted ATPase [uncultured Caudovirales phage]|uniref:PhoH Phosphate starvation-inducible protein PhoH, predicted ATPase n=1 Tax=uncultured Caudovirales phage TaxID=2100421 RepID=A0A6J5M3B8_9CAUD|nr:PhoH Phosphate starvation-inducible protein PhoH, predicted ATPase [uncultured Caudovirales phage]